MSRGLSFGGRVFAPSAGFTVAALVLCALFARLGAWQWHKGSEREEQWARFARGADQVIALGARAVSGVPLYQRVSVTGRLEGSRQFLRDWQAPGMAPLRHLSYAIQWWSFAALALIVWALMSTRKTLPAPTR